jgi:hypothetical protein
MEPRSFLVDGAGKLKLRRWKEYLRRANPSSRTKREGGNIVSQCFKMTTSLLTAA